jgi:hypothetical protein
VDGYLDLALSTWIPAESFHDSSLRDKRYIIILVVVVVVVVARALGRWRKYLNSPYKYHDNDQRAARGGGGGI